MSVKGVSTAQPNGPRQETLRFPFGPQKRSSGSSEARGQASRQR